MTQNNYCSILVSKGDKTPFFILEFIMEKIEFIASLPDILSAINIAGQDGNSRIKLDIPASEIKAVMKLIAMKGQAFKVTIEEER